MIDGAAIELADEQLDAIADRVAERLLDALDRTGASATQLVDANEIARRHKVTAAWVREHADELGAVRLGNGKKPRLRFDPAVVAERLSPPITSAPKPSTTRPRRRRRRSPDDFKLLPIAGEEG